MIYYSIYSILIHYDTLICGINLSKEFRNYFFQCCRSIWKKDAWLCIMIVTWCYEVNHTIFWYHSARKHVLEYVMFAYFTSDLQLCSDGRRVKEPFLDMFVDALTKVGAQPAWFLHIYIYIIIRAWWLCGFLLLSPSRAVSSRAKHTSSRQITYSTQRHGRSQRVRMHAKA